MDAVFHNAYELLGHTNSVSYNDDNTVDIDLNNPIHVDMSMPMPTELPYSS